MFAGTRFNTQRPISWGPDSNLIYDDRGNVVMLSDRQVDLLRRSLVSAATGSERPATAPLAPEQAAPVSQGQDGAQPSAEPQWMGAVQGKAHFYAARFDVAPGEVKLMLHDIFSMLSLYGVGPYVTPVPAGSES